LLSHGRWFSPGTPASSTTKTGRNDIAEILLKVALNTINQKMYSITVKDMFYITDSYSRFCPTEEIPEDCIPPLYDLTISEVNTMLNVTNHNKHR